MRWMICSLMFVCVAYAQAEVSLKVMSFNVRYGTALDGPNSWPHRKDILVNTLRTYNPDVCGLQECLVFQAEYMVSQLPEYRWLGIDRDVSGKGEMTAILYKYADLHPIESGNFWISETPEVPSSKSWDSSLPRIATWARFYHSPSGSFFYLLNTHLDHRGEEARAQGVRLLAERTKHLPNELPLIVLGDFNATAGNSVPYSLAIEYGFSDAWTAATQRIGPAYTFSGFSDPVSDREGRIDWILVRGPIHVSHCETVVYNESGRYPSDHYPVFAILTIRQN